MTMRELIDWAAAHGVPDDAVVLIGHEAHSYDITEGADFDFGFYEKHPVRREYERVPTATANSVPGVVVFPAR